MPRFQRPQDLSDHYSDVAEMAKALIARFETHATLIDHHVRIDFLFAFGDRDETTGELTSDALKLHGVKALGIAKKLSPKDRAKGLGDAEICLDGDWWADASHEEREALLDHELHHLCGTEKRDNLGRPVVKMRQHDYQFGWFSTIAARHGMHSQEQQQARAMMEVSGQFFWPSFCTPEFKSSRITSLEMGEVIKLTTASGKTVTAPAPVFKAALAELHRQKASKE